MSKLTVGLHKLVDFLQLNSQDAANLKDDFSAAVLDLLDGRGDGDPEIKAFITGLVVQAVGGLEGRILEYVENRLAGRAPIASLSSQPILPAEVDPTLISAAPSPEALAAATAAEAGTLSATETASIAAEADKVALANTAADVAEQAEYDRQREAREAVDGEKAKAAGQAAYDASYAS